MSVELERADTIHRRALTWFLVSILAAAVAYIAFRGYLSPELLFNFANGFYC